MRGWFVEDPSLSAGREIIESASTKLQASLSEVKSAPTSEAPLVAVYEALQLARNAVDTASVVVQTSSMSSTVRDTLVAYREKALEAVRQALATVSDWRTKAASSATDWLQSTQSSAVRRAAELDSTYGLVDKTRDTLETLESKYQLSERLAEAAAKAQQIATAFSLQSRVAGAFQQVRDLDTRYVGGAGAKAVGSAIDYAQTVKQQFDHEKQGIADAQGSGSAPDSKRVEDEEPEPTQA